jgi:hypothetical protein
MKYIKKYENQEEKKVYWISKFDDKFANSLVKLHLQYSIYPNMSKKIEIINSALELALDDNIKSYKKDYIIISMTWYIDEYGDSQQPNFEIWDIDKGDNLEKDGYIWIGYAPNTNKENYELYLNTKKYNL